MGSNNGGNVFARIVDHPVSVIAVFHASRRQVLEKAVFATISAVLSDNTGQPWNC